MIDRYKKYGFLFQELVHRDFTKKYKRTALGICLSERTLSTPSAAGYASHADPLLCYRN